MIPVVLDSQSILASRIPGRVWPQQEVAGSDDAGQAEGEVAQAFRPSAAEIPSLRTAPWQCLVEGLVQRARARAARQVPGLIAPFLLADPN
jgi:hypothetical protein